MDGEKKSFFYKFMHSLAYRLLTCVLVAFLPFCVVSLILVILVLSRSSVQIRQSYQIQLDGSLQQLEQDTRYVEAGMDEFVSAYITELNSSWFQGGDITLYDMIQRLSRVLGNTQEAGMVSVYEKTTERVLIQESDMTLSAGEIDELSNALKGMILEEQDFQSGQRVQVNKESFLVRVYDYQNYRVIFWFDMGENLASCLRGFFENGDEIFAFDGTTVYQVDAEGQVTETDQAWEDCIDSGLGSQTLVWQSDSLPVSVCVRSRIGWWQLIPGSYWVLVVAALGCMFLIPFFWKLLRLEVLIPFSRLSHAMEEMKAGHLDFRLNDHTKRNSDDVQYLFDSFDEMAAEVEKSREKDQKMYQTELDNLRLQVNPHMLLNSFNMIYSLAQSRNYACIQEYSLHLVDYFRYALRKNDSLVPLSQELDFVQSYIEIQKIRFPGAFSSNYSVEEDCRKALVPPLLVQNFIENAMKYALKPGKVVEVLLNIRREGDRLLISVCDTGKGIKPEILSQLQKGEPYVDRLGNRHIGVWNCKRRIEVFYEEKAEISITSSPGEGTQVFINLPFKEVPEDEADDRG